MWIVRVFQIREVVGSATINAPLSLRLAPMNEVVLQEESLVVLDGESCIHFGIPVSLARLVRKRIELSLVAVEVPLTDSFFEPAMDWQQIGRYDLVVASLYARQTVGFMYHSVPPTKQVDIRRILELKTVEGYGLLGLVPCPNFHLFMHLDEERYEECKMLPPNTIFRLSMAMV